MSGKKHKREIKAQKRAAREAARRKERQRTIATGVILAVIVALGGVLIWVSLEDEPTEDDLLAELEEQLGEEGELPDEADPEADEADTEEAEEAEEAEGTAEDDRPVACGAAEPPAAGEDKPTYPDGPEDVIDPDAAYRAVIATSCGDVVIDLDAERAPDTVNSFVFLAEEGFYDGLEIFRNEPSIGILQTGAGDNDANWDVGYTLPDELEAAEADGYPPGAVAMANAGPDTAGSQFFFVYSDDFGLGPEYARFGTVVDGLDVLREIGDIPVEGDWPLERAYLETVTIEQEAG